MSVTAWGRSRSRRNNVCKVCGDFYVPGWYSSHIDRSAKHAEVLRARRAAQAKPPS